MSTNRRQIQLLNWDEEGEIHYSGAHNLRSSDLLLVVHLGRVRSLLSDGSELFVEELSFQLQIQ